MRSSRQHRRHVTLFAACALLAGCTFSYEIDAIMEVGAVVFRVSRGPGWWGPDAEICQFYVIDKAADKPEPNGKWPPRAIRENPAVVWGFEVPRPEAGRGCSTYPLRYGQLPAGALQTVAPKPLARGTDYYIWADAPGVSGDGTFRIVDAVKNID